MPLCNLKNVCVKNLPNNQKIDFINIDREGLKICILG